MRILALDWGTVRIGAAISDPEGKIAFPLQTPISAKNAAEEIAEICSEQSVEKILIGNPKTLEGTESASSQAVKEFSEQLTGKGLSVEFMDERFSTVAATSALNAQGLNQKQQREIKDNIAAQLLLQTYLDSQKN